MQWELDFRNTRLDCRDRSHVYVCKVGGNRDLMLSPPFPLCHLLGTILPVEPFEEGEIICEDDKLTASLEKLYFEGEITYWVGGRIPERHAITVGLGKGNLGEMFYIKDNCAMSRGKAKPFVRFDQVCAQFDATWVKECLRSCQDHHTSSCSISSSSLKGLHVIDCRTRTIVESRPSCEYVALSYVWSQAGTDQPDSVPVCLENAPNVIKDSIEVTLQLGFQYLWVDRYCIKEKDRLWQIGHMDVVYAHAQLTIIAAGDGDGLPGVNGTPRESHPYLKFGDFELIPTLPNLKQQLLKTEWDTRGWTYQEGVLSTRKLIFTQVQVYYECPRLAKAESVHVYHGYDAAPHMDDIILPDLIFRSPKTYKYGFMAHVSEFSKRNLTFDRDKLRAMQGILSAFAKSREPTFNFLGIPIVGQWDEATSHVQIQAKDSFFYGLCWSHGINTTARRVTMHPSWTWAGWTGGHIEELIQCTSVDYVPRKMWSDVWTSKSTGEMFEFPGHDTIQSFLSRHREDYYFLSVSAPTAEFEVVQLNYASLAKNASMTFYYRPSRSFQRVDARIWRIRAGDGYYAKYDVSSSRSAYFKISPDRELGDASQFKASKGIVIGSYYDDSLILWILLLEDKGGHYERFGICIMREMCWRDGNSIVLGNEIVEEWWEEVKQAPWPLTKIG